MKTGETVALRQPESPGCLVELDRNGDENALGNADHDEEEPEAVLVVGAPLSAMFFLERGRVPAVTEDDYHLDRSSGLDQARFDLLHDLGE
jgi:hypothetical protein